jgi:hypothetical protein
VCGILLQSYLTAPDPLQSARTDTAIIETPTKKKGWIARDKQKQYSSATIKPLIKQTTATQVQEEEKE